jgi:hypothetical protein
MPKTNSPQPKLRRSLPVDKRVRREMAERGNREQTPAEQDADKRYWDENKALLEG